MSKIYAGQCFRITVDTGVDLTTASDLKLKYTAPDRTTGEWIATIDPVDNTKMYYDVVALTKVGKWSVYAKATFTCGSIPGEKAMFDIYLEGE
jgi:hypothetical protein